MSFSYERYDRRPSASRRTVFGYWVPLVLTVTIATAGVAAWVWSERQDSDEDDADLSYGETGPEPRPPQYKRERDETWSQSQGVETRGEETFMARMSGALRRTPSPSQMLDMAGKRVVAGVAAAGAAVGGALQSIREERPDDFADHSRWSEEAQIRSADNLRGDSIHPSSANKGPSRAGLKRRTIVVVLSAEQTLDSLRDDDHSSYHQEHPSILSHLPHANLDKNEVIVLIYAPAKSRPASSNAPRSLSSSFSAINIPGQSSSSGDELAVVEPRPDATPALSATTIDSSIYRDIRAQALRLVEKDTCVMPFSTPTGHVHLLRHLAPDVVYMTENLAGDHGANVEAIKNWVHQVVVVVGGDGSSMGGLVDTEDEGEGHKEGAPERWWQKGDIVGLGKGVEVVDASRLDEDFERRVCGRD